MKSYMVFPPPAIIGGTKRVKTVAVGSAEGMDPRSPMVLDRKARSHFTAILVETIPKSRVLPIFTAKFGPNANAEQRAADIVDGALAHLQIANHALCSEMSTFTAWPLDEPGVWHDHRVQVQLTSNIAGNLSIVSVALVEGIFRAFSIGKPFYSIDFGKLLELSLTTPPNERLNEIAFLSMSI